MDLDNGRVVFGDNAATEVHARVKDPVCGQELEKIDAAAATDYHGTIFYFCSADCKARFLASPEAYVSRSASP
jgi:Cu+-exporting ATPase